MNDERAATSIDQLGQRVRSRRLEIGMSQNVLQNTWCNRQQVRNTRRASIE
jgi:hypothetical protein